MTKKKSILLIKSLNCSSEKLLRSVSSIVLILEQNFFFRRTNSVSPKNFLIFSLSNIARLELFILL